MVLHDLDNVDRRLIEALAVDGRATVTSLAQMVGLSGPSVHERLRKLEAAGAIRSYAALVDPDAVGAGVWCRGSDRRGEQGSEQGCQDELEAA